MAPPEALAFSANRNSQKACSERFIELAEELTTLDLIQLRPKLLGTFLSLNQGHQKQKAKDSSPQKQIPKTL